MDARVVWRGCRPLLASFALLLTYALTGGSPQQEIAILRSIHAKNAHAEVDLPPLDRCLHIASQNPLEERSLFSSIALSTPAEGEMMPESFQAIFFASTSDAREVTARHREFSLCYQSFLLTETHTDAHTGTHTDTYGAHTLTHAEPYFERCGLDVFDVNVLRAREGENLLVTSLFHYAPKERSNHTQPPVEIENVPRLVCRTQVRFRCCATSQRTAEDRLEDFAEKKAREYIEEMSLTLREGERNTPTTTHTETNARSLLPPFRSPLSPSSSLTDERERERLRGRRHVRVLVGIKSFAFNLSLRNAIRRTWFAYAKDTRKHANHLYAIDFLPFFLIGESSIAQEFADFSVGASITLAEAVQKERELYRDILLGEELNGAEDTYFTLAEKVLAFFKWTEIDTWRESKERRDTEKEEGEVLVIVCDDDVFLNLQELRLLIEMHVELGTKRLYAGEVQEERFQRKIKPIREPEHLHFLDESDFPFDVFPPFALGNFYLLSEDVACFLARNANDLRPVGTLEDVSVGFWLQAIQARAVHLPGVVELRRCLSDLTSFRAPGVSHIAQRFFAVAGLQSAHYFPLVDESLRVKVFSEDVKKVLFDGGNRDDRASESEAVLALYYSNVLERLAELMQASENEKKTRSEISKMIHPQHSAHLSPSQRKERDERELAFFEDQYVGEKERALWQTLISPKHRERLIPWRVVVVVQSIENPEENERELPRFAALLDELEKIVDDSHRMPAERNIRSAPVEFELVFSSQTISWELLELLSRRLWPMRFFSVVANYSRASSSSFASSAAATAASNNDKIVDVARYFASFDCVFIAGHSSRNNRNYNRVGNDGIIQSAVHPDSEYKQSAISEFNKNMHSLWTAVENVLQTKNVAVPPVKVVITQEESDAPHGFWQTSLLSNLRNTLASLITASAPRRRRALSHAMLSRSTVLLSSFALVFTSPSLYLRPWMESVLSRYFPSHTQSLSESVFVLREDKQDWDLSRVVYAENGENALQTLSQDQRNQALRGRKILFVTSFLDCGTDVDCLNRLYNALSRTLTQAHRDKERVIGVWHCGEALSEKPQAVLQKLRSLPWLRLALLPQVSSENESVSYMPTYTHNHTNAYAHTQEHSLRVRYLPVFANIFAEPSLSAQTNTPPLDPLDLLYRANVSHHTARSHNATSVVSYLYFRCDRVERESLFSALRRSFGERARALGLCDGDGVARPSETEGNKRKKERASFATSRFANCFNSDAVARYREEGSLFVVAAENTAQQGYVTEKPVHAWLAGAIPVYVGTTDIEREFNAQAFVHCDLLNKSEGEREDAIRVCVQSIQSLLEDPIKLSALQNASPMRGDSDEERAKASLRLFFWHESARDSSAASHFFTLLASILRE